MARFHHHIRRCYALNICTAARFAVMDKVITKDETEGNGGKDPSHDYTPIYAQVLVYNLSVVIFKGCRTRERCIINHIFNDILLRHLSKKFAVAVLS